MDSIFRYLSVKTKVGMAAAVVGVIAVIMAIVGWYWSQEPEVFDVKANAQARAAVMGVEVVPGFVTTSTTIAIGETLLHKPGGYISNDISLPSLLMDNIVSWEYGALIQLRDFTEAMREDMSRSQSQSTENRYLAKAEPKLKFDNSSWMFPPTESEYHDGLNYLSQYLEALGNGGLLEKDKEKRSVSSQTRSQFYARADNLKNWLDHASKRLGSISQRLSASVGQRIIDADEPTAFTPSDNGQTLIAENATPWLEIDNVFYEARGSTWAMLHMMKAIEVDFEGVLQKKAAMASLQQIIRELENTQETLWSPVVLNGKGMGLLANHSLVMANYVSRANAAIIDLKNLLEQG